MTNFLSPAPTLTLLIALTTSACSQQALYDSLQYDRQTECNKTATPSTYDDCIEASRESYQSYKVKRDELLK